MSEVLTPAGVAVTLIVSLFAAWRAWRTDTSSTTRADFDSLRDELRKQLTDERADKNALEKRVTQLERTVDHEKRQRGLAVTYIGTLVAALRRADVPVPDPPAGLEVDLRG